MASRICILDDDAAFLRAIGVELKDAYDLVIAESARRFRELFAPRVFDLVVLDMRLESGKEGLDVLREIQRTDPFQSVVVATAYADTETYLETLHAGALLYVDKNQHSPAALALLFDAVIQQGRLRRDQAATMRALERSDPLELIGISDAAQRLRKDIERAGNRLGMPILITGEPGSGRELVARNLHARPQSGSLRPVCLVPPTLLPKDDLIRLLFGAETGPSRRRGLLEDAHGGALVVRRADRLPEEAITLIVEAWSERTFRPIGATISQPFEAALFLICEDDKALRSLLSACPLESIEVPSLRDRKEDIPLLASYFLDGMRRRGGEGAAVLDAEAGQTLLAHAWPGNVAELKAALEYSALRAAAEGESTIALRHLPVGMGNAVRGAEGRGMNSWDLDYREAMAQVGLVEEAIRELATTNKTKLAGFLHVPTPTTLSRRVERSLEKYPDLARAFPRTAESFGKAILSPTA